MFTEEPLHSLQLRRPAREVLWYAGKLSTEPVKRILLAVWYCNSVAT